MRYGNRRVYVVLQREGWDVNRKMARRIAGRSLLLGFAVKLITEGEDQRIPPPVRTCLVALNIQLGSLKEEIRILDRHMLGWQRTNELAKRLIELPGVGPSLATALVASVADSKIFRSGRDFSAWIGLVPKENSTGGKTKLGNFTKQCDR